MSDVPKVGTGAGFDAGMRELETIVAKLESEQLTLEDALSAFEHGVGLVRVLNEKLKEAEQRLEVLSRAPDGSLRLRPGTTEKS